MSTRSVTSRLDRLEEKYGKTDQNSVQIFYYSSNGWYVAKDGQHFDTLPAAVDHVIANYQTKKIKVCEYNNILHHMTKQQLDKCMQLLDPHQWNEWYEYLPDVPKVPEDTKGSDDPFFDVFKRPSKTLLKVEKQYPKIKFELNFYNCEKYFEDQQQ